MLNPTAAATVLAILVILAGSPRSVLAAERCADVKVRATSEQLTGTITPEGASGPETSWEWKLEDLPAASDVRSVGDNDTARRKIASLIDAARAVTTPWYLESNWIPANIDDERGGWVFPLGAIGIGLKEIPTPPSGPGQVFEDTLRVCYERQTVQSLAIVVTTPSADTSAQTTLGEIAGRPNPPPGLAGLTPEARAIPVTLGSKGPIPAALRRDLEDLAARLFVAAKDDLTIGADEPEPRDLTGVMGVKGVYALRPDIPPPQGLTTGRWTILATAVPTGRIVVRVTETVSENLVYRDGPDMPERRQARLDAIAARLEAVTRDTRIATPDRLTLVSEAERDLTAFRDVPRVRVAASAWEADGDTLVYRVDVEPREQKVALSLGAGYSAEESFTGRLGLSAFNLLTLRETAALNVTAGPEVQKGDLSVKIPGRENPNRIPRLDVTGVTVTGRFLRDDDQRLGNRRGAGFDDRETSLEGKLSLGFDSFSADDLRRAAGLDPTAPAPWLRHAITADVGVQYGDIRVKAPAGSASGESGQEAAFTLDGDYVIAHDGATLPQRGFGGWRLGLHVSARKGLEVAAADFDYVQALVSLTAEVKFGFMSTREFFVRYVRGGGISEGHIPMVRLFRLGGNTAVRGMEDGEFVGRALAFDRIELGYSLAALGKQLGGPDLSGIYAKLFAERGRVTSERSVDAALSADRGAPGYGISAEFHQPQGPGRWISVEVGYAYSPESRLHPSGRFFTGVTVSQSF